MSVSCKLRARTKPRKEKSRSLCFGGMQINRHTTNLVCVCVAHYKRFYRMYNTTGVLGVALLTKYTVWFDVSQRNSYKYMALSTLELANGLRDIGI